jgi:gluconolactonase
MREEISMNLRISTIAVLLVGMVALSQNQNTSPAQRQGPGVQGPQDARYASVIAACKNPPAPRGGGGAARGQAPAQAQGRGAAAAAAPAGPREYTVTEIPGIIAAGQQWKVIWQGTGNNADGILGTDDGALLAAQNDNSTVLRIGPDGRASIAYTDTNTGGALSMNAKGALFVAERALNPAIRQLAPERKLLANRYRDDPLDCIGGVLNDLTADSKGGAYFTMGGLFYANPAGVVNRYGENLNTNGILLSRDEKTLYVTNGPAVVAFDVQTDGALTNQRQFVALPSGGGDGLTVDSAGRLYVTGQPGIHVVTGEGKYLGLIPTPRGAITAAFGGTDKKTLYYVANDRTTVEIYAIPMIAQGYKGRAK